MARYVLSEVASGDIQVDEVLLAHCGELPGLPAGATRLILDVRERTGSIHELIPDLGGQLACPSKRYGLAVVWPRAHLGKDFSQQCLASAGLGLREGGSLLVAARKQKGGKSLAKTIAALFGGVEVIERDRGYHLYRAVRGPRFDRALADELIERRYTVEAGPLRLLSRPGVFSRKQLDDGTRALLTVADDVFERDEFEGRPGPGKVIDLCAGIGPLGLWAATRWPSAEVVAVETNLRAAALIRDNAALAGVGERIAVLERAGLPATSQLEGFAGRTDLVLLNPPTHASTEVLRGLFDLRAWVGGRGRALIVVNRPDRTIQLLRGLGAEVSGCDLAGYFVLEARYG